MKTKTVDVEGAPFTIAKLPIDEIEAWEDAMHAIVKSTNVTMRDIYAIQRKACGASVAKAGLTDPKAVGRLDIDGLQLLTDAVLRYSNMVGAAQGEAQSP